MKLARLMPYFILVLKLFHEKKAVTRFLFKTIYEIQWIVIKTFYWDKKRNKNYTYIVAWMHAIQLYHHKYLINQRCCQKYVVAKQQEIKTETREEKSVNKTTYSKVGLARLSNIRNFLPTIMKQKTKSDYMKRTK